MATADRSLPKSGTSTGTPELGRTTIKPPKPFFLRSWFAVAIFVVLVAAHVYGWQEAEINPGLLVQKAPDMQRFMAEVLKPDVFTTDKKEVQMRAPVGGSATIVENARPVEASETLIPTLLQGSQVQDNPGETENYTAKLTLSSDTVAPGQEVTLTGSGFRPNTTGKILWQSTGASASIQNIGSFTTDANGSFSTPVKVPEDAERVVNASGFPNTLAVSQQWDVGGIKLSDTVSTLR